MLFPLGTLFETISFFSDKNDSLDEHTATEFHFQVLRSRISDHFCIENVICSLGHIIYAIVCTVQKIIK